MRIFKYLSIIVVFYLLAEVCGLLYFYNLNNGYITALRLFQKGYDYNYVERCQWDETIGPHPYFAIYYPADANCKISNRNNYGYKSHDIPFTKDPQLYSILVVGASSAEQIAGLAENEDTNILESYLNEKYFSPNGKPFRILNVSIAGAHQPTLFYQTVMFSEVVDHIISIEGFNNHWNAHGQSLIEAQLGAYSQLLETMKDPQKQLMLIASTRIKHLALHSYLKHSYIMYWFYNNFYQAGRKADPSEVTAVFPPLPNIWNAQTKVDFYFKRYSYYTTAMKDHAKANNLNLTIFIQPSPGEYKTLTVKEKRAAGDMTKYVRYKDVKKKMIQLEKKGFNIENIDQIFSAVSDEIYVDEIHLNPKGVQIISHEIADRLAKRYRWKKKASSGI